MTTPRSAPTDLLDFALLSQEQERLIATALVARRVHIRETSRDLAKAMLRAGEDDRLVDDAIAWLLDDYTRDALRHLRQKMIDELLGAEPIVISR